MFGSTILEVAIGMAFFYLLLSLICTAVQEMVSQVFSLRSNMLQKGLIRLLTDATVRNKVLDHPLISSLSNGGKISRMSYIPPQSFALAVLDVVAPPVAQAHTAQTLRDQIAALPVASDMRQALLPLVDSAGDDLGKARANVEAWFNSVMDRVSGTYKRWAQLISLIIALVLAIALNADSLMIIDSLARNDSLRQSLTAAAEKYVKEHTATSVPSSASAAVVPAPPTLDAGGKKDGQAAAAGKTGAPGTKETQAGAKKADATKTDPASPDTKPQMASASIDLNKLKDDLTMLNDLGLPLGWKPAPPTQRVDGEVICPPSYDWRYWLSKVAGLALTTVAVSLGAPFWFDQLNKLMNLRGSVKIPVPGNGPAIDKASQKTAA